MKLTNPFVLLVLVALVIAGFIGYRQISHPAPRMAVVRVEAPTGAPRTMMIDTGGNEAALADAIKQIDARTQKWADTTKLAASTPRIGLAPIVKDLQDQVRSNEAFELPRCMTAAKPYWIESQREVVDAFIAFMASNELDMPAHLDDAARAKRNFDMVLDGCRPRKSTS